MSLKKTFTAICFLLISVSISAEVPNTINYQGRLTDAAGDPVADGGHLVKFIIYDAASGGTDLWNTGFQTVNTVDGLFSYQLGSIVTLPNGIFSDTSRYLGLTIGTDPELTPRSRFISSAYAFEAGNVSWSNISSIPAGFADGTDNEGLSQTGDTMTGSLFFDVGNDGNLEGGILFDGTGIDLALKDGNNTKTFLYGSFFGEADFYGTNGTLTAKLQAGTNGGQLALYNTTGSVNINLTGNLPGNSSVILPQDAIDNTEILDEPGIASNYSTTSVSLTSIMQDLVTVSITIPSSGYIKLDGQCYVDISGSTGGGSAVVQIDETAGGVQQSPYFSYSGFEGGYFNSGHHIFNLNASRIYFKNAGTYTFRLEGMRFLSSGTVQAGDNILTAVYYPTSYGSVSTASTQPPTGAEATLVQSTNLDGTTEQYYKYDLRDLELQEKEAQLKAKEAELELLKAQQKQSRQE